MPVLILALTLMPMPMLVLVLVFALVLIGQAEGSASARPFLDGNSVEARGVFNALEQCLFHRIRTKDFGGEMLV